MTVTGNILEFASEKATFSSSELWLYLESKGLTSRSTMSCNLSKLVADGRLIRIRQSCYSKANEKNCFKAIPGETEKKIYVLLKSRLPFANYCIYNGRVLSPLQHHLFDNTMTYVEVDRDAVEVVFNILKMNEKNVWLAPNSEIVYRYIDFANEGIIVKPLVTESPLEIIDGIPCPTLEKLLVDIRKDSDFSYLQGAEMIRLWENGKELFNINTARLSRYARRRGLKI